MSRLSKLKTEFDKVIIKYGDKSCNVMLIKGLNVFTGLSKCHENDNFNRKLGREIALGRAEFASKLVSGEKNSRNNTSFGEHEAKFTTSKCGDVTELDDKIIDFLPTRKVVENS